MIHRVIPFNSSLEPVLEAATAAGDTRLKAFWDRLDGFGDLARGIWAQQSCSRSFRWSRSRIFMPRYPSLSSSPQTKKSMGFRSGLIRGQASGSMYRGQASSMRAHVATPAMD